jgi:hypothetical protein
MNNIEKTLLLTLMLFSSTISFAQKSDVGNWFIYSGNQAINKKWNWWNEVQYRNYNFIGDLQQLVIRTGIGYNLTENNNNILLGYAFINSQQYPQGSENKEDKVSSNENRLYEQFITRQNFGRVFIQHRYRVEERFLANDFRMRFRYQLSFNVPININTMSKNAFYASAYNEIFLNAQSPVFDRNRLYGGFGYVINKNFRVETGLMAQIQENTSRSQLQMMLVNTLPLNGK